MFHNKRITSLKTVISALFCAIILTIATPAALAAVVPTADLSKTAARTLSASLADLTGKDELILDHATGKAQFSFDIPAGDYASDLRLKIRAIPQGKVDPNARIMVQFNSAKPVPIASSGNGFSAQIELSGARVRSQNNTVTLTYTGADGSICSSDDHGKWIVDMKAGRLSADVKSKRSGYQIAHIEPRLAHPMTAPRTVAIIAKGDDITALEALTAQAIGLRVTNIPNFRLRDTAADLKIYVGTRAQLGKAIKNSEIAADDRPVIGVQSVRRKPQLVITADTQADVKALVQSFAYAHLPRSRRARVSLSDMSVQMPFSYETPAAISGRKSWSDLGGYNFETGFNPSPVEANFKVNNAQMSTGELRLGLSKSDDIADGSRIAVALNGAPLGYTKMDKASKTVAFPFPAGSLLSGNNTLTVTPNLSSAGACNTTAFLPPSVLLTGHSALTINSPKGGLVDLGSIAASGAPFSDASGALTDVYLTGSAADRASALRILAKAAQTSGEGWTAASFKTRAPKGLASDRSVFVIGPLPASDLAMLSGAPRAFQDAMRGRRPVKVAGGNASQAFALAARQSSAGSVSGKTGIATVFANGTDNTAVGVISAPRSRDFSALASDLIKDPNWSNLSGGVARWDRSGVTLLQTADTRLVARPAKSGQAGAEFSAAISDFNAAVNSRFASGFQALAALKPLPKPAQTVRTANVQTSAPVRVTAPTPQTVAYTPALRGRSAASITLAKDTPGGAKPALLGGLFDWSDFDAEYLKANVAAKTGALLGKPAAVKMPALSLGSAKAKAEQSFSALPNANLQSSKLLYLLVGIMALMLLGLAAPSSSNKNLK